MSFKEKKYTIKRGAISKEVASFLYDYVCLKRKVARTMFDVKFLSPYTEYFGVWNDEQVPNTYSHYSDIGMETLLENLKPLMEKETGLNLVATYTYFRIYKNGDILKRHKDRKACSVSTTMNLGGDPWPIYLSPNENIGLPEIEGGLKGITSSSDAEGIKVDLEPGDMLIYSGCELEHWREPFQGGNNAQVFLHYNNRSEPNAKKQKLDSRMHLGLPSWFKGKPKDSFK